MSEPTVESLPTPVARYLAATRPGFLSAAAVPVLVGLAAAYTQGAVDWVTALLTLIGAVAAQAGANVLNDAYDSRAGCDEANEDRVFPFTGGSRIIQNGVLELDAMERFGWLLVATAALIGIGLTAVAGPMLLAIGLAGLVLVWAYSAPPLRLCAQGLGELAVAVGFGVLIPVGTAYVQLGELSVVALLAGLPMAFLITLILYINQFPDLRADTATGKRHWVVRLGVQRARLGYPLLAGAAYLSLAAAVLAGRLPPLALLALATLPLHLRGGMLLWRNAGRPAALRPAIVGTLGAAMLHGLLLASGLILSTFTGG